MYEFLSGVDIINESGTSGSWSNVISLNLRLRFSSPNSSAKLIINGKQVTITPDNVPPGFSVVNTAPQVVIEGKVSGMTVSLQMSENDSFEAFGYYIADGDLFKKDLMAYMGIDEVVKALGALQTTINNMRNEPVIVELGGW